MPRNKHRHKRNQKKARCASETIAKSAPTSSTQTTSTQTTSTQTTSFDGSNNRLCEEVQFDRSLCPKGRHGHSTIGSEVHHPLLQSSQPNRDRREYDSVRHQLVSNIGPDTAYKIIPQLIQMVMEYLPMTRDFLLNIRHSFYDLLCIMKDVESKTDPKSINVAGITTTVAPPTTTTTTTSERSFQQQVDMQKKIAAQLRNRWGHVAVFFEIAMFASLSVETLLWMMRHYDPFECWISFVRQQERKCGCHHTTYDDDAPEKGPVVHMHFQLGRDVNWKTGCFYAINDEHVLDCIELQSPVVHVEVESGQIVSWKSGGCLLPIPNDETKWIRLGRLAFHKELICSLKHERKSSIQDLLGDVLTQAQNRVRYARLAPSIVPSLQRFILQEISDDNKWGGGGHSTIMYDEGWTWTIRSFGFQYGSSFMDTRIFVFPNCYRHDSSTRWCEHDVKIGQHEMIRMRAPDIVYLMPSPDFLKKINADTHALENLISHFRNVSHPLNLKLDSLLWYQQLRTYAVLNRDSSDICDTIRKSLLRVATQNTEALPTSTCPLLGH